MFRFLARTRFVFAALLIAALTLLPTLEAAACATESAGETASLQTCAAPGNAASAAPDGPGGVDPGTCLTGHNHCHDGGGVVSTAPLSPPAFRIPQLLADGGRVLALSDIVHGLMRPPRR